MQNDRGTKIYARTKERTGLGTSARQEGLPLRKLSDLERKKKKKKLRRKKISFILRPGDGASANQGECIHSDIIIQSE